jgi:hypothetical protein
MNASTVKQLFFFLSSIQMDSTALFASSSEGLSVAESRTMERARMRNLNIQRKLDLTISGMHGDWESQIARISVEQKQLQRLLREMKEEQKGAKVILPRGLSDRHIQMIHDTREEADIRSISLREFDKKLNAFNDQRQLYRNNWQRYKKSSNGRNPMLSEVEQRCVATNVHFNPYRKADKDRSLSYQLQQLSLDLPTLAPSKFYEPESA